MFSCFLLLCLNLDNFCSFVSASLSPVSQNHNGLNKSDLTAVQEIRSTDTTTYTAGHKYNCNVCTFNSNRRMCTEPFVGIHMMGNIAYEGKIRPCSCRFVQMTRVYQGTEYNTVEYIIVLYMAGLSFHMLTLKSTRRDPF